MDIRKNHLMQLRPNSLVDILRWRAANQPHRLAFRFLQDGEDEASVFNYESLDQRARGIAAALQAVAQPGDRALLLLPAGLDFIAAYFGCLYAKVIAIPVPSPHPKRLEKTLTNTLRIAADARPAVALLDSPLRAAILADDTAGRLLRGTHLLAVDADDLNAAAGDWQQPAISENDIAFLQYTSGSTTAPKGVIVSHGNLLHNLDLIESSFGHSSKSEGVIWLPPYHDMGLIGGILQPVYAGFPVTLLSHLLFLQRPLRWLKAISRYRATSSGAPNFAYDLCLRKINPEQRDQLDLSHWDLAFNGAEPLYHKTLIDFAEYFAPCGFRREAFFPCYGLAEATLMVTGGPKLRPLVTKKVARAALGDNDAILSAENGKQTQTLVGCGQNLARQNVKIVDVETLESCPPGKIGEVWVGGPSVAQGYWNKPAETTETFGARIAGSGEGPFLRTGDLGFFEGGELFVTGRLKNLIITDGKNHYPHDIERTIQNAHPAVLPSGCAVFAIDESGQEKVVAVAEVRRNHAPEAAEISRAIRTAIAEHHELRIKDVKLTLPASIPRTTSGKIRHFVCKNKYLTGTLKEITTA